MGSFRKGGFSNNRFVLKPDVAIGSEVSILSKNSLAMTDFHAKKTQRVQLFENPLPGTPPLRDSQGKGESEVPGGGGGGGSIFYWKSQEGGSPGGRGADGPGGCLPPNWGIGGGGAKYFFLGPKCPPSKCLSSIKTE